MSVLIPIAFISGLLTIFSPCIWSILPVVISSSATIGKSRALSLTAGIVSSFIFFTATLSYLARLFNLEVEIFRIVAIVIIVFSGLTMTIPFLTNLIEGSFSRITRLIGYPSLRGGSFSSYITGASLGILWTPCSGPILLTVATLAASQVINLHIITIIAAFGLGAGLPLFILAISEQWLFTHHPVLTKYTRSTQKIFGVLIIVSAVFMYTNYDKTLQAKIIAFLPITSKIYTTFENTPQVSQELEKLRTERIFLRLLPTLTPTPYTNSVLTPTMITEPTGLIPTTFDVPSPFPTVAISLNPVSSLPNYGQAQEIQGIIKWFNTPNESPITLAQLRGKVILLDFWSITCTWCLPTIPYKNTWYSSYKHQGFEIVSIHIPGYQWGKSIEKITEAIDQYGILYPVGVDNNYATWDLYKNKFIPSEYLLDREGNIRYTLFSAGEYDKTEEAIRKLLE